MMFHTILHYFVLLVGVMMTVLADAKKDHSSISETEYKVSLQFIADECIDMLFAGRKKKTEDAIESLEQESRRVSKIRTKKDIDAPNNPDKNKKRLEPGNISREQETKKIATSNTSNEISCDLRCRLLGRRTTGSGHGVRRKNKLKTF